MGTLPLHQAKRPRTGLAGPYGHPFHPILITIPIGAWVASLIFDIASRIVDDGADLARGATWLIVIGIIGALIAAVFGLLDLSVIPRGTKTFTTGLLHMILNLLVVLLFAVNALIRRDVEGAVELGPIAFTVVALAILGASGWLGGKLAYSYGVRVADEQSQAEGFVDARQAPPEA